MSFDHYKSRQSTVCDLLGESVGCGALIVGLLAFFTVGAVLLCGVVGLTGCCCHFAAEHAGESGTGLSFGVGLGERLVEVCAFTPGAGCGTVFGHLLGDGHFHEAFVFHAGCVLGAAAAAHA